MQTITIFLKQQRNFLRCKFPGYKRNGCSLRVACVRLLTSEVRAAKIGGGGVGGVCNIGVPQKPRAHLVYRRPSCLPRAKCIIMLMDKVSQAVSSTILDEGWLLHMPANDAVNSCFHEIN